MSNINQMLWQKTERFISQRNSYINTPYILEGIMKSFKYFIAEATMFGSMSRGEWFKYGNDRLNKLKDIIKDGDPVSDVDGKDLNIKNTKANIQVIDDFIEAGPSGPSATFTLELDSGTVESNKIGKSPAFGGKGKGQGATGNTAKGESLQCLYLAAMLKERGKPDFPHFSPELLKKSYDDIDVDATYDEIMKIDPAWHYSAYVSAEYLINKKFVNKNHVFHRGSAVMKKIYAMKKTAFKNSGKPALTDDKWNPGDIWAVEKTVNVSTELDSSSIESLNASIIKAYNSRKIVGISLKQVNSLKKTAKHTEYNLEVSEPDNHIYTSVKLKSDGSTFWKSKYGFIFFDRNRKMDMRAPANFAALNVEIQGKGARGGRAGYSQIEYAAKVHMGKTLPTNRDLVKDARDLIGGKNKAKAKAFYNMLATIHPEITENEFMSGLIESDGGRIHANLGITYIANALNKSTKSQRDKFVSHLVNYAGSKSSDASAYVKIESR